MRRQRYHVSLYILCMQSCSLWCVTIQYDTGEASGYWHNWLARRADNSEVSGSIPECPTQVDGVMVAFKSPKFVVQVRVLVDLLLVVSRTTQWMDLTHPVSLLREGSRLCLASAPQPKKVTHYGDVAQLVERLPCKQEVEGSIPFDSSRLNFIASTLASGG